MNKAIPLASRLVPPVCVGIRTTSNETRTAWSPKRNTVPMRRHRPLERTRRACEIGTPSPHFSPAVAGVARLRGFLHYRPKSCDSGYRNTLFATPPAGEKCGQARRTARSVWRQRDRGSRLGQSETNSMKTRGPSLCPTPGYFGQSEQVHDPLGEALLAQHDVELAAGGNPLQDFQLPQPHQRRVAIE